MGGVLFRWEKAKMPKSTRLIPRCNTCTTLTENHWKWECVFICLKINWIKVKNVTIKSTHILTNQTKTRIKNFEGIYWFLDQAKLQKERVSPCEHQDTGVPGALLSNQDESSVRIPANQNISEDSLSNQNDSLGRISSNQTTSKGKVLNNHTEASEGFSFNENSELRSLDSITHKLHNSPGRTQPEPIAGSIPCSVTDGGGTGIVPADKEATQCSKPLHIVWAHRW